MPRTLPAVKAAFDNHGRWVTGRAHPLPFRLPDGLRKDDAGLARLKVRGYLLPFLKISHERHLFHTDTHGFANFALAGVG